MKSGLQRIEATLDQLHAQNVVAQPLPPSRDVVAQLALKSQNPAPTNSSTKTYSFDVRSLAPASQTSNGAAESVAVQPFPVKEQCLQAPNLPKFKLPSFSNHRHAANPGFAMSLLKEMETVVSGWQSELRQIVLEIQEIYLEGPIVDGWLESENRDWRSPAAAKLRHADPDRLMDYAQEIGSNPALMIAHNTPQSGYRLCGLDENGQLWSRPCPPDQLPHVSMAIARYQKLRQLLARKQDLELRLSQFAQDLIGLHSKLQG